MFPSLFWPLVISTYFYFLFYHPHYPPSHSYLKNIQLESFRLILSLRIILFRLWLLGNLVPDLNLKITPALKVFHSPKELVEPQHKIVRSFVEFLWLKREPNDSFLVSSGRTRVFFSVVLKTHSDLLWLYLEVFRLHVSLVFSELNFFLLSSDIGFLQLIP